MKYSRTASLQEKLSKYVNTSRAIEKLDVRIEESDLSSKLEINKAKLSTLSRPVSGQLITPLPIDDDDEDDSEDDFRILPESPHLSKGLPRREISLGSSSQDFLVIDRRHASPAPLFNEARFPDETNFEKPIDRIKKLIDHIQLQKTPQVRNINLSESDSSRHFDSFSSFRDNFLLSKELPHNEIKTYTAPDVSRNALTTESSLTTDIISRTRDPLRPIDWKSTVPPPPLANPLLSAEPLARRDDVSLRRAADGASPRPEQLEYLSADEYKAKPVISSQTKHTKTDSTTQMMHSKADALTPATQSKTPTMLDHGDEPIDAFLDRLFSVVAASSSLPSLRAPTSDSSDTENTSDQPIHIDIPRYSPPPPVVLPNPVLLPEPPLPACSPRDESITRRLAEIVKRSERPAPVLAKEATRRRRSPVKQRSKSPEPTPFIEDKPLREKPPPSHRVSRIRQLLAGHTAYRHSLPPTPPRTQDASTATTPRDDDRPSRADQPTPPPRRRNRSTELDVSDAPDSVAATPRRRRQVSPPRGHPPRPPRSFTPAPLSQHHRSAAHFSSQPRLAPQPARRPTAPHTLQLDRTGGAQFGFYIAQTEPSCVLVTRLRPNSSYGGLICAGDRITHVNGTPVAQMTLDDVYQVLARDSVVTLRILPVFGAPTR